jgi:hypothetical protein
LLLIINSALWPPALDGIGNTSATIANNTEATTTKRGTSDFFINQTFLSQMGSYIGKANARDITRPTIRWQWQGLPVASSDSFAAAFTRH